ncbi:MAG: tRNA (adenosine(37)-N6)-threonylcarbamoyltransferase complex ATPase subunit type 1 TsaE [Candidatus Moraniibacteriota bacterium]
MKIISTSSFQTKKIGQLLAEELRGGEIICLSGDLGAGKTTFTQGLLRGLKIKGPYTSPTFTIVKEYTAPRNKKQKTKNKLSEKTQKKTTTYNLIPNSYRIFHIDAYRITSKDLLELGFADFAGQKKSIVIIEWPEKVKKIIPPNAVWINFQWVNEKEREITFDAK